MRPHVPAGLSFFSGASMAGGQLDLYSTAKEDAASFKFTLYKCAPRCPVG
jgi:hypothetical protein